MNGKQLQFDRTRWELPQFPLYISAIVEVRYARSPELHSWFVPEDQPGVLPGVRVDEEEHFDIPEKEWQSVSFDETLHTNEKEWINTDYEFRVRFADFHCSIFEDVYTDLCSLLRLLRLPIMYDDPIRLVYTPQPTNSEQLKYLQDNVFAGKAPVARSNSGIGLPPVPFLSFEEICERHSRCGDIVRRLQDPPKPNFLCSELSRWSAPFGWNEHMEHLEDQSLLNMGSRLGEQTSPEFMIMKLPLATNSSLDAAPFLHLDTPDTESSSVDSPGVNGDTEDSSDVEHSNAENDDTGNHLEEDCAEDDYIEDDYEDGSAKKATREDDEAVSNVSPEDDSAEEDSVDGRSSGEEEDDAEYGRSSGELTQEDCLVTRRINATGAARMSASRSTTHSMPRMTTNRGTADEEATGETSEENDSEEDEDNGDCGSEENDEDDGDDGDDDSNYEDDGSVDDSDGEQDENWDPPNEDDEDEGDEQGSSAQNQQNQQDEEELVDDTPSQPSSSCSAPTGLFALSCKPSALVDHMLPDLLQSKFKQYHKVCSTKHCNS